SAPLLPCCQSARPVLRHTHLLFPATPLPEHRPESVLSDLSALVLSNTARLSRSFLASTPRHRPFSPRIPDINGPTGLPDLSPHQPRLSRPRLASVQHDRPRCAAHL